MTTDQDLPLGGQSAAAVFAARGVDVTPSKDRGVIKVPASVVYLRHQSFGYYIFWKVEGGLSCVCRLWSVRGSMETGRWSETKLLSTTQGSCWTGRSLTAVEIAKNLFASMWARVGDVLRSNLNVCFFLRTMITFFFFKPKKSFPQDPPHLFYWHHPLTGQVLKAWDIGVLSMQRGEVCTFLCKPEYAYGTAGNPDKIPPSSSVLFEVSGKRRSCRLFAHEFCTTVRKGPRSFGKM